MEVKKMSIDKQYNDMLENLKIRRIEPVNKKPEVVEVPQEKTPGKAAAKKPKKKKVSN
jgi:hypothetical protein